MRISPVASLRGFATVYTELAPQHAADARPLLLRVRAAVPRRRPRLRARSPSSALTAYTSPFVAEAIRSGINGVPVGQAEAARSIGLGFGQTVGLVVLPQAIRMVIPPLINVFIALTKNTSVAGGFFVVELFDVAQPRRMLTVTTSCAILLFAALLYLVITVPLGLIAGRIEKKVVVLR